MPYYLHAFFKAGVEGDPPETRPLTVNCMEIVSWQVNRYGKRLALRVALPKGLRQKRPFEMEFDFAPGNRFYIVKNDPAEVQAPNGPIIAWFDDDTRPKYEEQAA